VRTKVKTPGTGKIWWERLCKLLPWRDCANSIISQSRVHAWSPTLLSLLSPSVARAFLKLLGSSLPPAFAYA
jgi:hypothetical protein